MKYDYDLSLSIISGNEWSFAFLLFVNILHFSLKTSTTFILSASIQYEIVGRLSNTNLKSELRWECRKREVKWWEKSCAALVQVCQRKFSYVFHQVASRSKGKFLDKKTWSQDARHIVACAVHKKVHKYLIKSSSTERVTSLKGLLKHVFFVVLLLSQFKFKM